MVFDSKTIKSGGVIIGAGNPPLNKKLIHRKIISNSHKKKEQEKK